MTLGAEDVGDRVCNALLRAAHVVDTPEVGASPEVVDPLVVGVDQGVGVVPAITVGPSIFDDASLGSGDLLVVDLTKSNVQADPSSGLANAWVVGDRDRSPEATATASFHGSPLLRGDRVLHSLLADSKSGGKGSDRAASSDLGTPVEQASDGAVGEPCGLAEGNELAGLHGGTEQVAQRDDGDGLLDGHGSIVAEDARNI